MARRGNGEGTIFRRSDGRWCATISLPGRRKSFYGATRAEVATKLVAAQKQHQDGLGFPSERQTVAQYLSHWLETAVKPSVRPRTFEAYDLNVRRLVPHIGAAKLTGLTPARIQSAYTALLKAGLSRRSVEQTHTVLHGALAQAFRWGLLVANPTDRVTVPRPEHREMQTLDAQQVNRLFEASREQDRLHALWVVAATAGLRLGEASGLKWADLDLEGGRVVIRRALQRQRGAGLVLVDTKSASSRRTVHLSQTAIQALREHRLRQVQERLAAGPLWQDGGLVFSNLSGGPLDPSRVNEAFKRALTTAGLPDVRLHDLRHSAASLLLADGVPTKVIQELLGHSSPVLTLRTYSHTSPGLHEEAALVMDRLLERARRQV